MMYTEEEMRRKWCHRTERKYIKHANGDAPALDPECCCIASQCGAWRWGEELRRRCKVYGAGEDDMPEPPRPENVPPSWEWEPNDGDCLSSWVEPEADAQKRRHGYCGLAGRDTE